MKNNHPFNLVIPEKVCINTRINIVAISLFEADIAKTEEILTTQKLDKFTIRYYRPASETTSYGVIGPIEAGITEEELMNLLKCYLGLSNNHNHQTI